MERRYKFCKTKSEFDHDCANPQVNIADWFFDNGMALRLPIRQGGTYWEIHTDCEDHCSKLNKEILSKKEYKEHCYCDFHAPCHTLVTGIEEKTFDFTDTKEFLENLGTKVFLTREDAEAYAAEVGKERKKIMNRFPIVRTNPNQ